MSQFYSDENLPIDLVQELRELGYDVLTSYEAKQANQAIPDPEVLAYATALDRSVITLDREDFLALHRSGIEHGGIVVCKDDRDYQGQARSLHAYLITQVQGLQNRLIRVQKQNQPQSKQKIFIVREYQR